MVSMPERCQTGGRIHVNRRQLLRLMAGGVGGTLISGSSFLSASAASRTSIASGSSRATYASQASHTTPPAAAVSTSAKTTTATSAGGKSTLVVAANFDIQSLDPASGLDSNAEMINHATYDSLVTFIGGNDAKPSPSLAKSWAVSEDGLTYTFTLQSGVKFNSGNPLTSSDVKWSFDRVKNLKSNPAFLLDPVAEVQAPSPETVILVLTSPYPGIIPILSSPSLGVIDSKLVMTKGGVSGSDASTDDKAGPYLNQHSAGSGPFALTSYTPNQQATLVNNPHYWRGAASIARIVLQNITEAASEKTQLVAGSIDIATGLTQDLLPGLKNVSGVTVQTSLSPTTFYVLMNNNSKVGGPFSNSKVQQAVRYALDYDGILALAGEGAARLAGVIPTPFPGSLPSSAAIKSDPDKAKSLLKEANVGTIVGQLSYASDQVFFGVQSALLAQKVQSDLSAVGMKITLAGLPTSPAIAKYRAGQDQIGVWSWTADYPDASDFMVFAPGQTVGKRAGWLADASPAAKSLAALAKQAETEVNDAKRVGLYQQFGQKLNEIGPYAPLFLPAAPFGFRSDLQDVSFDSVWRVNYYPIKKTG